MKVSIKYIEENHWEFNEGEFRTIGEPQPNYGSEDKVKCWTANILYSNGKEGKIFWKELPEYTEELKNRFPYAPDPADACNWNEPIKIE